MSRLKPLAAVTDEAAPETTERIDLYQIHRWDEQTPIEETMEALTTW